MMKNCWSNVRTVSTSGISGQDQGIPLANLQASTPDSSCWIPYSLGQLEALGFAASPETRTGYAIPIENVYEDIHKKLGAKIMNPEWED